MSDEPDSLVLRMLRRLDEKMDCLIDDVGDLKRRVTSLEQLVALLHTDVAGQSSRIDRIETRLERIERRLDLTESHA